MMSGLEQIYNKRTQIKKKNQEREDRSENLKNIFAMLETLPKFG